MGKSIWEEDRFIIDSTSSNDGNIQLGIGYTTTPTTTTTSSGEELVAGTSSHIPNSLNTCAHDGKSGVTKDPQNCSEIRIVPTVPDNVIPKKGDTFNSMMEAINVYRRYASLSGFGVRLGTENLNKDKTLQSKYVRCNRYGKPKKTQSRSVGGRKSWYKRCGCQARIMIHRHPKTEIYEITSFEPIHNHALLQVEEEPTITSSKGLSFMEKDFIMKASTLNIGPTRAYKLNACFKGGYHRIKTSKNAFKNFWRDYISLVGPNDAQWVVDQLLIRKNTYPNFFFKYRLNGPVLDALFWVDELAKENYSLFSDAISVDATYRTNRYRMIFVPFTAINNHNKSINVGSTLLSDETTDSYTWLLETFLEAHGHAPNLVLSDQDAALNHAISNIFSGSTHRLCMWHIMEKLPHKISTEVIDNTTFKKQLHKLVWSIHLDIAEFEEKWRCLISDFKLQENKWLHDMYEIRDKWIPAYFRHIPFCGLMKTTSRSESANSFFNVFTNSNSLLVNFMFNYDTAVTKQRYDQHEFDLASNTLTLTIISDTTNKDLELHAASIYTRTMFTRVQNEIRKAITLCFQQTFSVNENWVEYTIVFKNHKNDSRPEFQVRVTDSFNTVECTCRCFNNFGFLCCHAFRVLLNNDIKLIPEKYIARRWQKNIIEFTQHKIAQRWGIFESETSHMVVEASAYYERCLEKVVHNKQKLGDLISKLKELDISLEESIPTEYQASSTRHFVEKIVGVDIGNPVEIDNPSGIKNKGGSKRTRLKSAKEKSIATAENEKRVCRGCNQLANHDKRNCPINPSNKLKPHKKIKK